MEIRGRMKYKLLIGICIIIIFSSFASAWCWWGWFGTTCGEVEIERTTTRSPTTETICGDDKCQTTFFSGERDTFIQNSTGDWVDVSDVLSITRNSDDLTFHYYNGMTSYLNLTLEAGVIYNGNYYSMAQVKQMYPQIEFSFPTQRRESYRKYAVNITNIPLNKSLIENITLTYKEHSGFSLNQLKTQKGKFIARNTLGLTFEDLIKNGFIVEINKNEKRIYIGNLTKNFIGNDLYLDPEVSITSADNTTFEDTHISGTDGEKAFNFGASDDVLLYEEDDRDSTMFFRYNNIYDKIPSGSTITNATWRIHSHDNSGGNINGNFTCWVMLSNWTEGTENGVAGVPNWTTNSSADGDYWTPQIIRESGGLWLADLRNLYPISADTWYDVNLSTSGFQDLFDNPTTRYGWICYNHGGAGYISMDSSEHAGGEHKLIIEYNLPNIAPTTPDLNEPVNETFVNDTHTALNWSNSSDVNGDTIYYYLEVDDDNTFASVVSVIEALT
jgi:hypothetical protein